MPYDQLATPVDAMREYARNAGAERDEQAWILTGFDVWMENPYYRGPEVPHPETGEFRPKPGRKCTDEDYLDDIEF